DFLTNSSDDSNITLRNLKNAGIFTVTKVEKRNGLEARRVLNKPGGRWDSMRKKISEWKDPTEERIKELEDLAQSLETVEPVKITESTGEKAAMIVRNEAGLVNMMSGVSNQNVVEMLLTTKTAPTRYPAAKGQWDRAQKAIKHAKGSSKMEVAGRFARGSLVRAYGLAKQGGDGTFFCNRGQIITAWREGEERMASTVITMTGALRRDIRRLITNSMEEVEGTGGKSMSVRTEGGSELDDGSKNFYVKGSVSTDQLRVHLEMMMSSMLFEGQDLKSLIERVPIESLGPGPLLHLKMLMEGRPTAEVTSGLLKMQICTLKTEGTERVAVKDRLDNTGLSGYAINRARGREIVVMIDGEETVYIEREREMVKDVAVDGPRWPKLLKELMMKAKIANTFYVGLDYYVMGSKAELYEAAEKEVEKQIRYLEEMETEGGIGMDAEGNIGTKGPRMMSKEEREEIRTKCPKIVKIVEGELMMGLDKVSTGATGDFEVLREKGNEDRGPTTFYEGLMLVNSMRGTIFKFLKEKLTASRWGNINGFGIRPMESCSKKMDAARMVYQARTTMMEIFGAVEEGRSVGAMQLVIVMRACFGNANAPARGTLNTIVGNGFQISVVQPRSLMMSPEGELHTPAGTSRPGVIAFKAELALRGSVLGGIRIARKARGEDRTIFSRISPNDTVVERKMGIMQLGDTDYVVNVRPRGFGLRSDIEQQMGAIARREFSSNDIGF
ncbi:putative polymerase basic 2, partial [Steelhead trout orthomyxovirus-1]